MRSETKFDRIELQGNFYPLMYCVFTLGSHTSHGAVVQPTLNLPRVVTTRKTSTAPCMGC